MNWTCCKNISLDKDAAFVCGESIGEQDTMCKCGGERFELIEDGFMRCRDCKRVIVPCVTNASKKERATTSVKKPDEEHAKLLKEKYGEQIETWKSLQKTLQNKIKEATIAYQKECRHSKTVELGDTETLTWLECVECGKNLGQ